MEAPGRVYVVGSLNHDLVLSVPSLPTEGETVIAGAEHTAPGGKGANQAVAAARAGALTTMIGAVGRDTAGDTLLRQLTSFGVDVGGVLRSTAPSGSAIVLVSDRGDNQIVVRPGANAGLPAAHVSAALSALRPADVVAVQCELSRDVLVAALRAGHASGACVVLNWAPAVPLPADVVARASVVVVNRAEATALTHLPASASGHELAETLHRQLGPVVVVTLGAAGSVAATSGRTFSVPSVPATDLLDTTGAGDSYVGTLAAALARGDADVQEAMAAAAMAATLTVQHAGAQPPQPCSEISTAPTSR